MNDFIKAEIQELDDAGIAVDRAPWPLQKQALELENGFSEAANRGNVETFKELVKRFRELYLQRTKGKLFHSVSL